MSSGFSSLQFAHTFSGQLDCVRRVDYAVEDGVGHSRVTHHVVPARGRIPGGDDDRFALLAVFDDVEKDWTLLCIERHKEEIIKDEQLTAFDFLEFGLEAVLDFCDLELSEQLGGVGIQGAYAPFACLVSQGASQEALARSG